MSLPTPRSKWWSRRSRTGHYLTSRSTRSPPLPPGTGSTPISVRRRPRPALRPGGALATVTTIHVSGGTEAFFADAQACYQRWDPATPPSLRLPALDTVAAAVDEVDASQLFLPAVRRRYQQDIAYTTSSYLDLLRAYSGHRVLAPDRRQPLLACIAELIDQKYGGTVVKRYMYELRVARKHPSR
ncbi:MAG: hypothetical protein ACRDRY_24560 [Pseudonocardiaceae bacterium]